MAPCLLPVIDKSRPQSTHRGAKYAQRLCRPRIHIPAPSNGTGSSEIGSQDQGGNAIKTITGRIVRSDNLLSLVEEGSIRTYRLADASRLRAYEGKKVRISGVLDSPHVIAVRTIDEVD